MTSFLGTLTRPAASTDDRERRLRRFGIAAGAIGLAIATVGFVASLDASARSSADGAADAIASSLILAFGLSTLGFATIKLGIGVVLVAIVRRLWVRIDAVRLALPGLIRPDAAGRSSGDVALGEYESSFGPATASRDVPAPLPIHRAARLLWAPMLAMGAMLVVIGFIVDLAAAATTGPVGAATTGFGWAQGLLFLGETSLLAGISFLLATILASIRSGGGEVQHSLGLPVKTLRMPSTAKAFVGLMMAGVLVGIVQFVGYVAATSSSDPASIAAAFAWLGPLREFGLGLLLAGIVLALATIARALGFQFSRLTEIITTGR